MDGLRASRASIFADAKVPLPDVDLPAEQGAEIMYKGVPLSQASWSEKLVLGCRVAMALNPDLKIVRIQNGSELDHKTLAMLEGLFGEADYQLWIELVGDKEGSTIHMQDGLVDGKLPEALKAPVKKRAVKKAVSYTHLTLPTKRIV